HGLIASVGKGEYVEPSKATVADFVRARVNQWEAAGAISARTAQRYRQLVENQIVPHLGTKLVQKLRPLDIEEWHTTLRSTGRVGGQGGLAARTIGHAHKIVGKALRDAARNALVSRNVVSEQSAPKVNDDEMVIVQDVPALVDRLIVTISKRLGHAKPDITLRIYAHLFRKDDSKAAAAIDATFKR